MTNSENLLLTGNFARIKELKPTQYKNYFVSEFGSRQDQDLIGRSEAYKATVTGDLTKIKFLWEMGILHNPHPYLAFMAAANSKSQVLEFLVARVQLCKGNIIFYYKTTIQRMIRMYDIIKELNGFGPRLCMMDKYADTQNDKEILIKIHQYFNQCVEELCTVLHQKREKSYLKS